LERWTLPQLPAPMPVVKLRRVGPGLGKPQQSVVLVVVLVVVVLVVVELVVVAVVVVAVVVVVDEVVVAVVDVVVVAVVDVVVVSVVDVVVVAVVDVVVVVVVAVVELVVDTVVAVVDVVVVSVVELVVATVVSVVDDVVVSVVDVVLLVVGQTHPSRQSSIAPPGDPGGQVALPGGSHSSPASTNPFPQTGACVVVVVDVVLVAVVELVVATVVGVVVEVVVVSVVELVVGTVVSVVDVVVVDDVVDDEVVVLDVVGTVVSVVLVDEVVVDVSSVVVVVTGTGQIGAVCGLQMSVSWFTSTRGGLSFDRAAIVMMHFPAFARRRTSTLISAVGPHTWSVPEGFGLSAPRLHCPDFLTLNFFRSAGVQGSPARFRQTCTLKVQEPLAVVWWSWSQLGSQSVHSMVPPFSRPGGLVNSARHWVVASWITRRADVGAATPRSVPPRTSITRPIGRPDSRMRRPPAA
jgi:hypothetical protein